MLIKRSNKFFLSMYIILSFLFGFNAVFIAYIIKTLIEIVSSESQNNFLNLTLIGASGFIIFFILGVLMDYFKNLVIKDINLVFKRNVCEKYFESHMSLKKEINLSGFVQSDLKLLENNGVYAELQMISLAFTFIISLIASLYLDLLTTLSFFVGAFLSAVITMLGQAKIEKLTDIWSSNIDTLVSELEDSERNKMTHVFFNTFKIINNRIQAKIEGVENSLFDLNFFIDKKNQIVFIVTMFLSIFIPFIVGGLRISTGVLTIAGFIAIMQLSNSIINPLLQSIQLYNERIVINSVLKKYHEISNYPNQTYNLENRFSKLHYENIINKVPVTIDLNKGESLLIKGTSGSGKSTLLNNIICPLDFTVYTINDKEVDKGSCYTELFSYVPQNPVLYNDTLEFNLTLGKKYSYENIINALKLAELEEFVNKNGLDFKIDKDNANISGGEAQRITIARAIINNNEILVLDEITASLDQGTANKIRYNLLNQNKTVIEVAHHLNSEYESKFDHIITLVKG